MQLSDQLISDLIGKCLYTAEELEPYAAALKLQERKREEVKQGSDKLPPGALVIDGIVRNFVFHPGRVAECRDTIREMLDQLPDDYKDGYTFLNLCNDKHGTLWTGLQRTMEALVVLAIAADLMEYCMPRFMWAVLPGGMPYVKIKSPDAPPATATGGEVEAAKPLRFLHVRVLQKPEVVSFEHPVLETYQALVGGLIERVPLEDGSGELGEGGVDLWCNEEGLIKHLGMNRTIVDAHGGRHHIYGDFFVARTDAEGNIAGLTDEDIVKYTERFS